MDGTLRRIDIMQHRAGQLPESCRNVADACIKTSRATYACTCRAKVSAARVMALGAALTMTAESTGLGELLAV